MPIARLSLAQPIETRDGSLTKDSRVINCVFEDVGGHKRVVKRPGLSGLDSTPPGIDLTGIPESTWVQRTLATAQNWQGITYGGGLFVVVGDGAVCNTSPDGITWTARSLPSSADWRNIIYANGQFVLNAFSSGGASTNKVATSPDGITWTARTLPISVNSGKIAWNGSVYCSLVNLNFGSPTNICFTSPDGITWTQQTMASARKWTGIAWNGSVFCAVEQDINIAATSPDGITWTDHTMSFSQTVCITWNGSVFCSASYNSSNGAATSPDGITWTQRTPPSNIWFDAVSVNNTLGLIGPTTAFVYSINNGLTWTSVPLPSAQTSWSAFASSGSRLCAITNQASSTVAATLNFT